MPYNHLTMEKRIKHTFFKIKGSIYRRIADLDATAYMTTEPVAFEKRADGSAKKLKPGDNWGNLFDCAWIEFTCDVPGDTARENLVLIIDISGEGLIVDSQGMPLQGITTVNSMYDYRLGEPGKKVVYRESFIIQDRRLSLWIDAGNNDLFGNQQNGGTLVEAYLAECDYAMKRLYYDFEVLDELRGRLPKDKVQYHMITRSLYEACLELSKYDSREAEAAHGRLVPELTRLSTGYPLSITAIGHSHIDLAWLWPVRETIRKGARTFSTALMNLEKYPDYVFGASQPQLYQWMKDHYPRLYGRICKKIEEGRWEPQGAMWVEADTNISGGEALVRQILYGKKFFKDEFGVEIKNLWLPDVFGYSAALPQLLKKSGVDYFMTIKISWSEFNGFPHHTFIWKGLDGSCVLAHMPPEGTYNSSAAPRAILDTEEKFKDKGVSDECLLLFGIGDGGGGPGEEHLERLSREKDLMGLAPVTQGFASDFFERINKNTESYKTWHGELYLEHHRGTYTSEGRNKRYNKLLENLFRDIEIISVVESKSYPSAELERLWKEVLLYQFHDILPGSSIKRVYDESLERYALIRSKSEELLNQAAGSVEKETCIYKVFNTNSWSVCRWIKRNGCWKQVELPGMSSITVDFTSGDPAYKEYTNYKNVENDILRVDFDDSGYIKSIYDKENNKDIVPDGKRANVLKVYEDFGDAWDFAHDYESKGYDEPVLIGSENGFDGPFVYRTNEYNYGESVIRQTYRLCIGSRRLDIINDIDWRTPNRMLRADIPLTVSSKDLTCGIQFGYISRPSHDNTSWDMAKLEVCAHDYVDISQTDYGVAVMSDYKYGYSSTEDSISINLLRSTGYPDASGDIGRHEFTYSIYPHKGGHLEGKVIEQGRELSRPLRIFPVPEEEAMKLHYTIDTGNIMIEAIKKPENGPGLIVRLYEAYGSACVATLSTADEIRSAFEVNLIEDSISEIPVAANGIELKFKPFEIKSLRLVSDG